MWWSACHVLTLIFSYVMWKWCVVLECYIVICHVVHVMVCLPCFDCQAQCFTCLAWHVKLFNSGRGGRTGKQICAMCHAKIMFLSRGAQTVKWCQGPWDLECDHVSYGIWVGTCQFDINVFSIVTDTLNCWFLAHSLELLEWVWLICPWGTVKDITCHMVWRPSLEGVWPCLRPGCFRDHKCCHVAQDFVAQDSRVTCHLSCVTMAFLATTGHLFIWFHASRVEHIVLLEDGSTGERRVAFRRTTRPRASHWFVFMCAWLLAKIFVVVLTYI